MGRIAIPQRLSPTWRSAFGLTATERVVVAFAFALLFVSFHSAAGPASTPGGLLLGIVVAEAVLLLALPRWPLPAFGALAGLEALYITLVPLVPPEVFNAVPVATVAGVYLLAQRRSGPTAWAAGLAAAALIEVVGFLSWPDSARATSVFAFDRVVFATAAGVLIASRQRRLVVLEGRAVEAERARDEEAARRVAAERLRMAQELHDLVAHNIALVNAQSSVAEYLLESDPTAAAKALHDISEHSRQALDELRATVGLLRQAAHIEDPTQDEAEENLPTPGLSRLEHLLQAHRAVGAAVGLEVTGEPQALSALCDLAAYRIAQEALTNARKHAPGADIRVALAWSPQSLALRVSNTSPPKGPPRHPAPSTGHGLLGMRERAVAAGGSLNVAPRPDGGYLVEAVLPVEDTSPPRARADREAQA